MPEGAASGMIIPLTCSIGEDKKEKFSSLDFKHIVEEWRSVLRHVKRLLQWRLSRKINPTLDDVTSAVVPGVYSSSYSWRVTYHRSSASANAKIGKNLARLRKAAGVSQAKMAERLGISLRHFQRVESGESAPSIPLLTDLHKILRTTWEEIFLGLG